MFSSCLFLSGVYFGHDDSGAVWHYGTNRYQAKRHPCGYPHRFSWHWSGVHCSHCPGRFIYFSNDTMYVFKIKISKLCLPYNEMWHISKKRELKWKCVCLKNYWEV